MSELKKIQVYENGRIRVTFDPNICHHSGVCLRGLPEVFNLNQRPWIKVDNDSPEAIQALVERCPSGALTFALKDGESEMHFHSEPEPEEEIVTITISKSLKVAGKVRIVDKEGNVLAITEKCSFCRCGASKTQPFCDNTHREIGWEG